MDWNECLTSNLVERRTPDKELAKSLFRIAVARFAFFSSKEATMFTLEGIYESIIELCHALLSFEGMKTLSHECAIAFLKDRYLSGSETECLDKLRKKRHGIKYYGRILNEESLQRNIKSGKTLFIKIKSIVEEKLKK